MLYLIRNLLTKLQLNTMIKFFRKIRQQLLNENKTRKYLKYAVGEIILVMIVILLALQVNNWNENRKKEVIEIQFLKRLVNDLASDTLYFTDRIKVSNDIIANNYKYIHQAYEEIKNMEDFQELVSLFNWNSTHFVCQNSTYLELLNAGQLNIFKNIELKVDIITLYKDYEIDASHIKEFNNYSTASLEKAQITNFTKYWKHSSDLFDEPYMFKETEWQFINNPSSDKFRRLEITANTYYFKHKYFRDYYVDLKEKATILINDIERELENRN